MSHTPWVSSDAWGIFYLLKLVVQIKVFLSRKIMNKNEELLLTKGVPVD